MASRLTQLARIITENAREVEEYLQQAGEPQPSFDIGAPKKLNTSGQAEISRNKAIDAANELSDLLKGPAELLRFDWTERMSLQAVSRFKLAALVPVGSGVSFSEIAQKAHLPERDVCRIMRHAMTRHVFHEPKEGFVAHTALSQWLKEDVQQQDIVSTVTEVLLPSALRATDAMEKWPGSEEPSHTGFSLAVSPGKSMWQAFQQDEGMGRRFGVFIGGSQGDVMKDVLANFPDVREAVVQDLSETVEKGIERHGHQPRLRFQAHDFFSEQTETADIFFFRWIFHNWSDKYSIQILRNLIPALRPGNRLIINDFMLPEPNTLSPGRERAIR